MIDGNEGDGSNTPRRGIRKDGKPYKEGNTRDDGSYAVGGYRPPDKHKYRKGDGRERGRRGKGRKNLLTEWREELDSKVFVSENGVRRKITKRRALIKSKIKRGIEKSDRAAETALRYDELSERRDPGLQADDLEIIEAWLRGARDSRDSDDTDTAVPSCSDPESTGENPASTGNPADEGEGSDARDPA